MSFDYSTLITNRAEADAKALRTLTKKPLSQWTAAEAETFTAATLKGSYDYTDLNRVSTCVEDLVARLNWLGYNVPGYAQLDPYTWYESDTPTEGELAAYLGNVEAVRRVLRQAAGTPATPESMAGLTWQAANDIEQILKDLDELLTNAQRAWYYSGEVYAGEI